MITRRKWIVTAATPLLAAPSLRHRCYIGTYSRHGSEGIYTLEFDASDGTLSAPTLAAEAENPSFLVQGPAIGGRPTLYAVSEVADGRVMGYRVNPDARLSIINSVSSKGGGPCHVAVHPRGVMVAVANYSAGNCVALPLDEQGRLSEARAVLAHTGKGPNAARQEAPHAHSASFTRDGQMALSCDLGTDEVYLYRVVAQTVRPHQPPSIRLQPGSGPRHLMIHPALPILYVLGELTSTIHVFRWDQMTGRARELQSLTTLPANFRGSNTTAELALHPSGQFLFCSNRGHDSLALFRVQPDGQLKAAGHGGTGGKTPRHFSADPSGRWILVANQDSNSVTVLAFDAEAETLTATGGEQRVGAPVCVQFLA